MLIQTGVYVREEPLFSITNTEDVGGNVCCHVACKILIFHNPYPSTINDKDAEVLRLPGQEEDDADNAMTSHGDEEDKEN